MTKSPGAISGLQRLAAAAGLAADWTDYRGQPQRSPDDALKALLAALGAPAGTAAEIAEGLDRYAAEAKRPAPMITAVAGERVALPGAKGRARLRLEDGRTRDIQLTPGAKGGGFTAPHTIGYHRIEAGETSTILATAPRRAVLARDLTGGRPAWGAAAQLYSLNHGSDFGDFGDLADLAQRLAVFGADAVAVSPTHALFTADLERYAPYGPSTRLFLNPLYATAPGHRPPCDEALIEWPAAAARKLAALREAYDAFRKGGEDREAFHSFVRDGGENLLGHARFEALDARFRPLGYGHWRDWPDGYADVTSPAVAALKPTDPEVEVHLYLQWRAAQDADAAQAAAKRAGMAIGVIADLAVGMDGAGSHAWSRPDDVLHKISIGAPPDLLAREGQSWGLTTFSPTALRREAYAPFLATLRAALRHAGGVRTDHAIGLKRLWITPDGASSADGAYLAYPFEDLLRLIALESHRHGAVIIGEDLGTVPEGFRTATTRAGIAGMRVLWFERTASGAFSAPSRWSRNAVAMTTTHDLPTVSGWWRGRDLEWRARLGQEAEPDQADAERARDRQRLWQAFGKSEAVGAQPAPDDPAPVVDAAIAHLAASHCDLALIAMEDLLGLDEQPNLPGLTDPHPNWRRRLPPGDGLDAAPVKRRLNSLMKARGRPE